LLVLSQLSLLQQRPAVRASVVAAALFLRGRHRVVGDLLLPAPGSGRQQGAQILDR